MNGYFDPKKGNRCHNHPQTDVDPTKRAARQHSGAKSPAERAAVATLIADPAFRDSLNQIADGMARDADLHDDLVQEALLHLLSLPSANRRQTRSWFLKNCLFSMQHHLRHERSLQTLKFRFEHSLLPETSGWPCESVFATVSEHETIDLMSRHLKGVERSIFSLLIEGLKVKEIARELRRSRQAIGKHFCHIAIVARKVGIAPLAT